MTVVVWTPTVRPGLDVACASVARQECEQEIRWIVGDDLIDSRGRRAAWASAPQFPDALFKPQPHDDMPFTVDRAHNAALRIARDWNADLFVFMCDYTWIPADGVQRFADMAARHPGALLTGLAHTSDDPHASKIVDPDGAYTIFAEPFTRKPDTIGWWDIRADRQRPGITEARVEPQRCELNWAALTRDVLHDERVNFDERYDDFHSHDNIDFATRASVLGYQVWIDYENAAVRLPRRTYWPVEQRFEDAQEPGHKFFKSQDRGDRIVVTRDTGIPAVGYFKRIDTEWPDITAVEVRALAGRLEPFGDLLIATTGDYDDLFFAAMSAPLAAVRIDRLDNGGLGLTAMGSP